MLCCSPLLSAGKRFLITVYKDLRDLTPVVISSLLPGTPCVILPLWQLAVPWIQLIRRALTFNQYAAALKKKKKKQLHAASCPWKLPFLAWIINLKTQLSRRFLSGDFPDHHPHPRSDLGARPLSSLSTFYIILQSFDGKLPELGRMCFHIGIHIPSTLCLMTDREDCHSFLMNKLPFSLYQGHNFKYTHAHVHSYIPGNPWIWSSL